MGSVAVVTDSSASLPGLVDAGVVVVALQVVMGTTPYDDGDPAASPARVAAALREGTPVSTSRPSPDVVLAAYRQAAAHGADEVVSVHLSAQLSATFESAQLAARRAPLPVHPVDTGQIGPGTGFAALAAARAAAAGAPAPEAAAAARACADRTRTHFYVDTLTHLRRGGRIGPAAALLGSALAVKPILQVEDGRVAPCDKVRTSARALARLAALAVETAPPGPVRVCVCHLANGEAAGGLATDLAARLGERVVDEVVVAEVAAVLGAHVGPGLLGVTVAPAGASEDTA